MIDEHEPVAKRIVDELFGDGASMRPIYEGVVQRIANIMQEELERRLYPDGKPPRSPELLRSVMASFGKRYERPPFQIEPEEPRA